MTEQAHKIKRCILYLNWIMFLPPNGGNSYSIVR